MSNRPDARTSREEEFALLSMEQVLGVSIHLADAGGGISMPDGAWEYPDGQRGTGIVEITSPPANDLLKKWADERREGKPQEETGSVPLFLNQLDEFCTCLLNEEWALANIAKLQARPARERHLFLLSRSEASGTYFCRLSDIDEYGVHEPVKNIALPEGITDIWFEGRARLNAASETSEVCVARFQRGTGWHRYTVQIPERALPPPSPSIGKDRAPRGWRRPKKRTPAGT